MTGPITIAPPQSRGAPTVSIPTPWEVPMLTATEQVAASLGVISSQSFANLTGSGASFQIPSKCYYRIDYIYLITCAQPVIPLVSATAVASAWCMYQLTYQSKPIPGYDELLSGAALNYQGPALTTAVSYATAERTINTPLWGYSDSGGLITVQARLLFPPAAGTAFVEANVHGWTWPKPAGDLIVRDPING